jgi:hypothetical protein
MLLWSLAFLAVVFVVGLAGWAVARIFAGYPQPSATPLVLTRREMALLAAAADAMYPPGGELPPSGSEAGVPAYADRYAAVVPPSTRLLMRLLFFLMEHATLFFPGPGPKGWRRFSSLSEQQRVAVLEGWRASRFFPRRLVFNSLRAILTMGYFAHPPVLRKLQLAPYAIDTPIREADLLYPPVGRHPSTIRWTRDDLTAPAEPVPLRPDSPLHPDFAEVRPGSVPGSSEVRS